MDPQTVKIFMSFDNDMIALMKEPSFTATGFNDEVTDETIVESKTFLRDRDDEDTDVVFARTIERNADGDVLGITQWECITAPTISDVVTDQSDDSTVGLTGTTELTITGTNFGAEDADLRVILMTSPDRTRSQVPPQTRHTIVATINSVNVGDTEIVATVSVNDNTYLKESGRGSCWVVVQNTKRLLQSKPFQLTLGV